MRKKKKNGWQALVTILLVCASILYIAYQAYRAVVSEVEVEMAVMHSVYDSIETQARDIASQRGWELDEVDPAIRAMANMTTRMRVPKKYPDSKIADMMIRGNTTGMIKSLKNLHRFNQQDPQVSAISQKLLDCETANIKQMQAFL